MARLVSELLALARADAGVPLTVRPVDLDNVVLETFQQARQLASGQRLVLDAIEPVSLRGDEDRLRQLLLILLDNALKYTPAGGEVRLRMTRTPGHAEMTVRDSGAGIPADALPHVFERFYRADSARSPDPGGSGLGLAIAQVIARQHGGDIAIRSQPGQGTEVTVRLPQAGGAAR
jgi:two-component system OmpR family sensor kinase